MRNASFAAFRLLAFLTPAAVAGLALPSAAAPVTAFGGYDYSTGAFSQRTHGYVAGATASGAWLGGADLTLAGMRYDDNRIGGGMGLIGGAGVPLGPAVRLRVQATRFVGDDSFRGWRGKVGPQFTLPRDGALTLSYTHYEDNLPARSDGALAEAALPIAGALTARMTGSCATSPEGPPGVQGTVGLGWRPVPNAEISGEFGVTRNAIGGPGQSFPGNRGLLGTGLLGSGGSTRPGRTTQDVAGIALIGIRVFVP